MPRLATIHPCHQVLLWQFQHTSINFFIKSPINFIVSVWYTITFLNNISYSLRQFINVNINLWKDSTFKCLMAHMSDNDVFITMTNTHIHNGIYTYTRYRPIKPGNSACCDIWHSSPEISPQRIARLGCSRSVNITQPPTATTSTVYPIECVNDFLFCFYQLPVILRDCLIKWKKANRKIAPVTVR